MAQYSPIYYAIQRCIQDKHRHKQMMQTTLHIIADRNVLFDIEKKMQNITFLRYCKSFSPLHYEPVRVTLYIFFFKLPVQTKLFELVANLLAYYRAY